MSRYWIGVSMLLCFVLNAATQLSAMAVFPGKEGVAELDQELIDRVNADNQKNNGAAPINADELRHGHLRHTIMVIDAVTMRPVTAYAVEGNILARERTAEPIYDEDAEPQYSDGGDRMDPIIGYDYSEENIVIGKLERREVNDPQGLCRYVNLGAMEVEFQITAQGYLPHQEKVKIPAPGFTTVIELHHGGEVKGQVVMGTNGPGVPEVMVALSKVREKDEASVTEEISPQAKTNSQGEFRIKNVPPGRYEFDFPNLFHSLSQVASHLDIEAEEMPAQGESRAESDMDYRRKRATKLGAKTYPLIPSVKPVSVREGEETDAGTILLELAPQLEITAYYDGKIPVGGLPLEIGYVDGCEIGDKFRTVTGDDGRVTLTLVGWQPGREVIAFATAEQQREYKVGPLAARKPVMPEQMNAKEYYEEVFRPDQARPRKAWPKRYEELRAPAQKMQFQQAMETERQEALEAKKRADGRPEHPNYLLFMPQRDRVNRVRLDYHPTSDTLTLSLRVRDKYSKKPVSEFTGVLGPASPDLRIMLAERANTGLLGMLGGDGQHTVFRSQDGSGEILLPALNLPTEYLDKVRNYEERSPLTNDIMEPGVQETSLKVVLLAPGYARQAFEIPLARVRSREELILELEPEARVRGRIELASNGEPLTSATLATYLRQTGYTRPGLQSPAVNIEISNATLESGRYDPSANAMHYRPIANARVNADGGFEITGLRPGAHWTLNVTVEAMPSHIERELELKPGLNELGEIRMGGAGFLTGRILDETGKGVGGVKIDIMQRAPSESGSLLLTTGTGAFTTGLRAVRNDRVIVRLVPPWGTAARNSTETQNTNLQIAFDGVMTLDRNATNTLTTRLDRGYPLLVEIPHSAARDALFRLYTDSRNWPCEPSSQYRGKPACYLHEIIVQGLDANPEGFVYQQDYVLPVGDELPTTQPLKVRLEHVPPGRCAVLVNGALAILDESITAYAGEEQDEDAPRRPGSPIRPSPRRLKPFRERLGIPTTFPLAYAEYTMPATTSTLILETSHTAEVVLGLSDPPPPVNGHQNLETMVFLDRGGATTTCRGNEFRNIFRSATENSVVKEPEEMELPLVSYVGFFARMRDAHLVYSPLTLRAVPPGTYRLRLFAGLHDGIAVPPQPYYEETIEVPRDGRVTRELPYFKHKKSVPPTALVDYSAVSSTP